MTVKYSATVRNAQLEAKETAIGTAPILRVYNGSLPANCAATIGASTLLGEGTLPSDWAAAASGGAKAKSGTWTITGQSGASTGTAMTYYRIWDSAGTTCHEQGSITVTGGGGDMTVDNTSIANAQVMTVNTFTTTAGNA